MANLSGMKQLIIIPLPANVGEYIGFFFKKFELLNIAHYSPNIEKIDKLLGNILLMVVSLLFLTLSAKLFWLKSFSSKIGDCGFEVTR